MTDSATKVGGGTPPAPEILRAPWGKLRREQLPPSAHGLLDHMADVAACFIALTDCNAIRRALNCLAGRPLDSADIARLAVLAFLHDIGKANAGFQARWWPRPSDAPPAWPLPRGHGSEGWALLTGAVTQAESIASGLPLNAMASWGPATETLLHASISHHGRPVGDDGIPSSIWQPVPASRGAPAYAPATAIADMGACVQRMFPRAFDPCLNTLPDAPEFTHLFAGLIQLADWLGSDTRPGFFPYTEPGEDRSSTATHRARHAVRTIGLDVEPLRGVLRIARPSFTKVFEVPAARPIQSSMETASLGPLVILEAETGSGKTEAALWRFVQLFQRGAVDSLFFALPTRVAATQIYSRIRDCIARLWPEDAPVVVQALPGYASADGQERISLPDFQVQWPDSPADQAAHRRWAAESPKRFLAATIAVGTIDQALLGALMVRHAHLRHAMLTRSLLVVDEVHASDAYMNVLLEQLLKAHLGAGGHALLLSATLGAVARTRFLALGSSQTSPPPPSLAQACTVAYPCLSSRVAEEVRIMPVEGNPRHKRVHWQALDAIDDAPRIAALAFDAATDGACVLVIRNTVPAAVATLQAIERMAERHGKRYLFEVNGISTLHHSRFSKQDRPLLDAAVQAELGKLREALGGRIIVGTQTLEQSLDIDADLLITDLCPMDVLLQRIGRLHRHARPDEERPLTFRAATARVLTPAGHDLRPLLKRSRHGLGRLRDGSGVYPDLRILEATRRLVEAQPTRSIPADNRMLVEQATHPDALLAIETDMGIDWQQTGQAIDGKALADRSLGRLHTMAFDRPFGTEAFPDQDEKIATRLGAADRLIEVDPPLPGPFGLPVSQLTLRHHQIPTGLSPDAQPTDWMPLSDSLGRTVGFEFMLGTQRYRYSRFGLERLKTHDQTGAIA